MYRRIIFYSLLLIGLLLSVRIVWLQYMPKDAPVINDSQITYEFENNYSIENYEAFMRNSNGDVIVAFYDKNDIASAYFFNKTWPEIKEKKGIVSFTNILYVDVSELITNHTVNTTRYGFTSTPSLTKLKFSEGKIVIVSALNANGTSALTVDQVEQWLTTNGVLK